MKKKKEMKKIIKRSAKTENVNKKFKKSRIRKQIIKMKIVLHK